MITMQQTDFKNGEIIRIGFTSMGHYADVAIKNGRVSELIRVQLEVKEYRHIDGAAVEGEKISQDVELTIINRAKNLLNSFQ